MKAVYVSLLAILMIFPLAVFAKAKPDSTKVNFPNAVVLNGKKIPAGRYDVAWSGKGPMVNVSVKNNGKVIASGPAKLVKQDNPFKAVESRTWKGKQILMSIDRPHLSLKFRGAQPTQTASK